MTNFNDLAVLQKDSAALVSFWHVINGIYIWEYFTALYFELDMILGRRSYRWTIWIYSFARIALLMAVIFDLYDFDVTTPINCQVFVTLQVVFAYLSQASASLLIVVRIIAIWNRHKFAVAFAVITCIINVSVIILGIARLRAIWHPVLQTCVIINSEKIKPTFIITVINDTLLLVTMLVGLFRLLPDSGYAFGLGRLLWKQGIIWLLIATVAGIPAMVFVSLNLNVPFNVMFLLPSVVANTIAATRIYRSLADYAFESSSILLDPGSKNNTKISKIKFNNPAPISLDRIEVAVDTAYERYPTSQTTLSVGAQQGDKPHESSIGSDLECAKETLSDLQIPAAAATVQRGQLLRSPSNDYN